ncbi:GIY-YIG nuclease family protein [Neokomagataea thailandica]|uniref:GIY-YIG domain-containing protein n=1 Tax=Neokomagataea tanensis NBRC 106556 TaxID=1223519 RepID=A0ABQ0QLU3_9PROT|nr:MULTISPECIES: GIY-YIG nuclease family protein [Neokomagataea]GBR49802.1 hypothetical protein AA106556_2133 [Neokomagataea tanensis NBRC 106556]
MTYPQTIQIFLPSGDPQGIRVSSITTRIVQVFEIPRVQLNAFLSMPEADHVGFYVLFGSNDETGTENAYIGQSGNIGSRLKQHNEKKDFWDRALVSISLTRSLTVTHAYFLEWLSIQRAKSADRFKLENGNAGSKPHTPSPMEAECREIFDTVDILFTTLGFPIFKPLLEKEDKSEIEVALEPQVKTVSNIELILEADGVHARAQYTDEGVVVRKGSYGRTVPTETFSQTAKSEKRRQMVEDGDLRVEGAKLIFEKDVLFSSPSTAAIYVFGRSANGWTEWKTLEGRTLSDAMGRNIAP